MSDGTLYLLAAIGGVICLVVVAAIVETLIRKPKRRSLAETFDMNEGDFRDVHTSFGNPLGHGDIERASDYMRRQIEQKQRAEGARSEKESGT